MRPKRRAGFTRPYNGDAKCVSSTEIVGLCGWHLPALVKANVFFVAMRKLMQSKSWHLSGFIGDCPLDKVALMCYHVC